MSLKLLGRKDAISSQGSMQNMGTLECTRYILRQVGLGSFFIQLLYLTIILKYYFAALLFLLVYLLQYSQKCGNNVAKLTSQLLTLHCSIHSAWPQFCGVFRDTCKLLV